MAIFIASLFSLIGIYALSLKEKTLHSLLLVLVAFFSGVDFDGIHNFIEEWLSPLAFSLASRRVSCNSCGDFLWASSGNGD
jgi:ABC-type enterochelin transport system permease subunit